eukprot:7300036-Pyramimonas_sp.AAC.1
MKNIDLGRSLDAQLQPASLLETTTDQALLRSAGLKIDTALKTSLGMLNAAGALHPLLRKRLGAAPC